MTKENKWIGKLWNVLKTVIGCLLVFAYLALAIYAVIMVGQAMDLPEGLMIFLVILTWLFAIPVGYRVFYFIVVEIPVRRIVKKEEFLRIVEERALDVRHCNELYAHIQALMKERPRLSPIEEENKHERTVTCTRDTFREAKKDPIAALFSHFDIPETLYTVHVLEHMLVNQSSTETAILWFAYLRAEILQSAVHLLPRHLRRIGTNELGLFMGLPLPPKHSDCFMTYRFEYFPNANVRVPLTVKVSLNSETVEKALAYLSERLKSPFPFFTVERMNRLLLTDNCTCQICGAAADPSSNHLNMELSFHKLPEDGGVCTEENLRVLCHFCAARERQTSNGA